MCLRCGSEPVDLISEYCPHCGGRNTLVSINNIRRVNVANRGEYQAYIRIEEDSDLERCE